MHTAPFQGGFKSGFERRWGHPRATPRWGTALLTPREDMVPADQRAGVGDASHSPSTGLQHWGRTPHLHKAGAVVQASPV